MTLMAFSAGDRVELTEAALRSFPKMRGRVATVIANPRRNKAIPTVGLKFDELKTVHYFHVDFLRHIKG